MTSLYKIAEMCKHTLGKGDVQAFIPFVLSAYAIAAKKQWFENVTVGDTQEINGGFISEFGISSDLIPVLEPKINQYYIDIPSSSLELPHDMQYDFVGFLCGGEGFVKVNNWNMSLGLQGSVLGGRQVYSPKGKRMYFPKMNASTVGKLLLRIAIALDTEDVTEELNIGQNMINDIITMVNQMYAPTPPLVPENLQ